MKGRRRRRNHPRFVLSSSTAMTAPWIIALARPSSPNGEWYDSKSNQRCARRQELVEQGKGSGDIWTFSWLYTGHVISMSVLY